jgi:gamma-polyglutamate biosynthesis protein CapA
MRAFLSLVAVGLLIGGSIYLVLQKPAPEKYANLIPKDILINEKPESVKILFVGDIMLDRGIRKVIDEKGFDYIVDDIKSIFSKKDLVIGNLEGTITHNDSVSIVNNKILHFTFATSTAIELKKIGFSGVSLANNHTLDFYQAGFDETKYNLQQASIFSFGHPLNNQNLSYKILINDLNICFVGYHSLYNASTTNILNEITNTKPKCNYLVVFAHWGIEYEDFENIDQQTQAHLFIDSGADLVIGAHPHVIQPIEIYKNKAIFYSLGNFIFDQDFSLKTRRGIAVEINLENATQTFKIIPLEITKGKLSFVNNEDFLSSLEILKSQLSLNQVKDLTDSMTLRLSN